MGRTKNPVQRDLRDLCWSIGQQPEARPAQGGLGLHMVQPGQAFAHWHMPDKLLQDHAGEKLVLRLHDVSGILFDGGNSHASFDMDMGGPVGKRYFHIPQSERHWLAEAGWKTGQGYAVALRSNTVYFDRGRAAREFNPTGRLIDPALRLNFPVGSIFLAPRYLALKETLAKTGGRPLHWTCIHSAPLRQGSVQREALDAFLSLEPHFSRMGCKVDILAANSNKVQVVTGHANARDVILVLDWPALPAGLAMAGRLGCPVILVSPHQPFGQDQSPGPSVHGLGCIITHDDATRQRLLDLDAGLGEIILHLPLRRRHTTAKGSVRQEMCQSLGLDPAGPIVFFAGEISHATGADLLIDALPTICSRNSQVQFVLAGNGPLQGELEGRAWHSGLGQRVRFLGHIPPQYFERMLAASDYYIVPARSWQDDAPVRKALALGVPVLVTHQSGIAGIQHGVNGLVTYDNSGSIVWGVMELLSQSLDSRHQRPRPGVDTGPELEAEGTALHYATAALSLHGTAHPAQRP